MFHAEKMFHAKNKKRLKKIKNSVALGKMGVIICLIKSNISKMNSIASSSVFVVTALSAASSRQCLLGHGSTKAEAIADAFGPDASPRSLKNARCYEVSEEQFQALRQGVNSQSFRFFL